MLFYKEKKADIIAVPSYIPIEDGLKRVWPGYSGMDSPDDVSRKHINKITEGEAWRKYALQNKIKESCARYGINVFLRGKFWDMGTDGYITIVDRGRVIETKNTKGATMVNFWLP